MSSLYTQVDSIHCGVFRRLGDITGKMWVVIIGKSFSNNTAPNI